jgi:hypothetical protein
VKHTFAAPMLAAFSLCALAAVAHAGDRVRIVNEGGIREQWMLADGIKLAAPGYPAAFAERGDNVCVAIGYAIKPDGTTSDFVALKNWSSSTGDKEPAEGFWDAFAQAGAGALSQWKFKPRPEVTKPQPTYTVATMHFMGKEATDAGVLRSHCSISDLAALVEQNGKFSEESPENSRARRDFERTRRTVSGAGSMVENPNQSARPAY